MRQYKNPVHAQRFLSIVSTVYDAFNLFRHLCRGESYKNRRSEVFARWNGVSTA